MAAGVLGGLLGMYNFKKKNNQEMNGVLRMPELSIIVPVYKVEEYLPKCIDSILAQTFNDFELILIDDGSPDRCGEICDEYAAKDSRIKVIHQKNQGVSAARNAGLDIATGTYLGFVDSDDWIESEMYETMILTAEKEQADSVICGINFYHDDGTYFRSDLVENSFYNKNELLIAFLDKPTPLGGMCWNKILLRKKVNQNRFNMNFSYSEDWIYLFECFQFCERVYKIPDSLYNVRERPESATRKNEIYAYYQIILACKVLLSLARNYSYEIECAATDKFLDDCIRYSNLLRNAGINSRQHWRWKFIIIRLQVLIVLPRVYLKKLLPKEKIHGYIYAMLKC